MSAPIPVELHPHDPKWVGSARTESARLSGALGETLIVVHHIGSTAIPGIHAKPIIDLMPIVRTIAELEGLRAVVEGLGYAWWGEYGLEGRRYCTFDDPASGRRKVQLHFYEDGAPWIRRHLAFRDYLRSRPDLVREYEAEKMRCAELHPMDSHAYTKCKDAWIKRVEAEALAAYAGGEM